MQEWMYWVALGLTFGFGLGVIVGVWHEKRSWLKVLTREARKSLNSQYAEPEQVVRRGRRQ